jgi:hypothetical protein
MEGSAVNPQFQPMLPSQARASERTHDVTILVTAACVIVGAMIAIYALAVSAPVDPETFATMVAFP